MTRNRQWAPQAEPENPRQRPEPNYRCMCHGTGILEVVVSWPAKTAEGNSLRTQVVNGITWYGPVGAACRCLMGQWVNDCRTRRASNSGSSTVLPVYDPDKMALSRRIGKLHETPEEARDRRMVSETLNVFDGVATNEGFLED